MSGGLEHLQRPAVALDSELKKKINVLLAASQFIDQECVFIHFSFLIEMIHLT